jgi:hypothetical protein
MARFSVYFEDRGMLYFASASIQTEATAVTLKSMQTKKPSSTTRDHPNAPLLLSNKKRGPGKESRAVPIRTKQEPS